MTKTLFLQFDYQEVDGQDVEEVIDSIESVTPDGINIVAFSDDFSLLDKGEVEEIVEKLVDALESGDD